ncbi:hypothetical protein [Microterricola pindariensis]|uniref:DUF3686 domain-containing protein n=1 Tax=Microterricola pindariensis TaxID=478010 RepID=A0ABX5AZ83_9MICO|nr:hypothetical protein [Microterricola pindariensis]PPL20217.1 hypothetical protein GY24_02275 [Microterricola pindariensis]
MRWESLFDDMESQLEQELTAEDEQLRAEEERLRLGRLTMRSRLAALSGDGPDAGGGLLRLELRSGALVTVRALTFGRDWLAGELGRAGGQGTQCVIPLAAVSGVLLDPDGIHRSLAEQPAAPARLAERIGLAFVLRDLCRRRAHVELDCGPRPSGAPWLLHGTIDRVGRDHCDLALHEPGTPRRESLVTGYRLVPFEQIMMLRVAG